MPNWALCVARQSRLRSFGLALAAAACFSAIPATSSIAWAAHDIFERAQFAVELGPAVTFSIARAGLVGVWTFNFATFMLVSLAVSALFQKSWPATRLLLASIVSGCLVLAPIFLLQPLRLCYWLSLGPLGAIIALGTAALLPLGQNQQRRKRQ